MTPEATSPRDGTHAGYRLIPGRIVGWRWPRLRAGVALSRSDVFHMVKGSVSGVVFGKRFGFALRLRGRTVAVYVERQTGSRVLGEVSTEIALAVPPDFAEALSAASVAAEEPSRKLSPNDSALSERSPRPATNEKGS